MDKKVRILVIMNGLLMVAFAVFSANGLFESPETLSVPISSNSISSLASQAVVSSIEVTSNFNNASQ